MVNWTCTWTKDTAKKRWIYKDGVLLLSGSTATLFAADGDGRRQGQVCASEAVSPSSLGEGVELLFAGA